MYRNIQVDAVLYSRSKRVETINRAVGTIGNESTGGYVMKIARIIIPGGVFLILAHAVVDIAASIIIANVNKGE